MIHTIETRLNLNTTQELLVDSCVVLWSTYYRKTWKLWNNQQLKETEIYHKLMNLNLFTSRQVGSLINKVKTEHAKIKELSKSQLKQQKAKLINIEKFISTEQKNISKLFDEFNNLKLKQSKVIKKTDELPDEWQYGRVKNFNRPYDPVRKRFINDYDYVAMTTEERNAKQEKLKAEQKSYAEELYKQYVDGKFKSVSAFYKTLDIKESRQALIQIWDRHIPEYKFRKKER